MEDKHRNILRRHGSSLKRDLYPENILPDLVEIFDERDEEEIMVQPTRQKRCQKLLEILLTKGPDAFKVFVNALNKVAPHLASKLIEEEEDPRGRTPCAGQLDETNKDDLQALLEALEKTLTEIHQLKSKGNVSGDGDRSITFQSKILVGGSTTLIRVSPVDSDFKIETEVINNNVITSELANDLSRITEEMDKLKERLQKLLDEAQLVRNLEKHPTTTFPATSKNTERKDESCSRCEALRSERDSTIGKIQTSEKEIQELKKNITDINEQYQRNTQTLNRRYQNLQEKYRNLSQEHEAAIKKHQEQIKNLNGKVKKPPEDQVKSEEVVQLEEKFEESKRDLEKIRKDLVFQNEKVKEYQQKLQAENKAKDDLLEEKLKKETLLSKENVSLQEKLREERSQSNNLKREVHRLRLTPKEMPGRIYNYSKDFDKRGVVYALTTNPEKTSKIVATRSSDGEGKAEDLLENQVKSGTVSGTREKEESWWCVDLTEKYVLYLTHYTLRHGHERSLSVLLNWRLEGSPDGHHWTILKKHVNDRGLKMHHPYCSCTWAIDGNFNAFRFFRIFQTGMNSSSRFGIFLSGIELYGVLIEKIS